MSDVPVWLQNGTVEARSAARQLDQPFTPDQLLQVFQLLLTLRHDSLATIRTVAKLDWAVWFCESTSKQQTISLTTLWSMYVSYMEHFVSMNPVEAPQVIESLVWHAVTWRTLTCSDPLHSCHVASAAQNTLYHQKLKDCRYEITLKAFELLERVILLVPSSLSRIAPALVMHQPSLRRVMQAAESTDLLTAQQLHFTRGALNLADRFPSLRAVIMDLLVSRCIALDVSLQVHMEEAVLQQFEPDQEEMALNEEFVPSNVEVTETSDEADGSAMDDSVMDEFSDLEDASSDDLSDEMEATLRHAPLVMTLDSLCSLLVHYHQDLLRDVASKQDKKRLVHSLFQIQLDLLDRVLLPTRGARHVTHLLFDLSATHKSLPARFLVHLLERLIDRDLGIRLRQTAAAYVASYVARARFLSHELVLQVFDKLLEFCDLYTFKHASRLSLQQQQKWHAWETLDSQGQSKHAVFVAVVQAVLYIYCFRWHLIHATSWKALQERRAALERILTSRLQPLQSCSESIAQEFSLLAARNQFVICSLPQKNMEVVTSSADAWNDAIMYPFDPCRLPRLSKTLDNHLYIEWQEESSSVMETDDDALSTDDQSVSLGEDNEIMDDEETLFHVAQSANSKTWHLVQQHSIVADT